MAGGHKNSTGSNYGGAKTSPTLEERGGKHHRVREACNLPTWTPSRFFCSLGPTPLIIYNIILSQD
jgi:hypothetical protein